MKNINLFEPCAALNSKFGECVPDVGFLLGVVGLGSSDPEFKSHSAVELISGGVESA